MLQEDIFICITESIKNVLKKLGKTAKKVLLVTDSQNTLLGTISDGDIRRYILSGKSLEDNIGKVYNENPIYIKKKDFSISLAKEIILKNKIELLPILDEQKCVVDSVTWDQLFSENKIELFKVNKINIPVVIMAGGKGTRLDPFTKILPKALIPIGDKPIIEIIIDEFKKQGVKEYYLSLNHRAKMVEAYFDSIDKDYQVHYIRENDFLGTAGSLRLLRGKIDDAAIVSNCDAIVKANFEEVVSSHKEQKAYLTILASIKHYKIPYGIIKFKELGEVTSLDEKPEYTFTINSGVYVLGKEALEFIPREGPFDMTDLIKSLINNNKKVVMYPVNENDYIDIGQWEEYKKATEKLKLFA